MSAIPLIAVAVILIVVLGIIYLFVKGIFKIISYIWGALFLVLVVLSLFLFVDISDFQDNFSSSTNLILLTSDNEVVTGFILDGQEPILLNNMSHYADLYNRSRYAALLGEHYKVLFVEAQVFSDVEKVQISKYLFDGEFVLETIRSENPMEMYAAKIAELENADEDEVLEQIDALYTDAGQFRSLLFASVFSASQQSQDPLIMVQHIQSGDIEIYPETITFRVMRYIPPALLENFPRGEVNGFI